MKNRIFADFADQNRASLPEMSLALLARQREDWPQLSAGYDALARRLERPLSAGGLSVVLQCNPQRIVSTQADVTPGAIQGRPCFLCPANLPVQQQAISYPGRFLVLCNPFPIVDRHFTVAHREHRPQLLSRVLPTFLRLARDYQPDFAVLYNGAQSGASVPGHLHFQALPKANIPALNESRDGLTKVREKNGLSLFKKLDGPRTALIVEGADEKALIALIRQLIRTMRRLQAPASEAMQHIEARMNLFCRYETDSWQVLIFPRRNHRPTAYYKAGADQIMVSPGAVDMGGVLVLPRKEDYLRLDATLLINIFEEVSMDESFLDQVVAAL